MNKIKVGLFVSLILLLLWLHVLLLSAERPATSGVELRTGRTTTDPSVIHRRRRAQRSTSATDCLWTFAQTCKVTASPFTVVVVKDLSFEESQLISCILCSGAAWLSFHVGTAWRGEKAKCGKAKSGTSVS